MSPQSSSPGGGGPVPWTWNISLAQKMSPPGALSLWYDSNTSISAVTQPADWQLSGSLSSPGLMWFFSLILFRQQYEVPLSMEELSNSVWKWIKLLFYFFFSSQLSFLHWFILCIFKEMFVHINYRLFQAISSLGIENFSGIKAVTLVLARKGNAGF